MKTVERSLDETTKSIQFNLEQHSVDKEENYIDSINWFGILVPQTLKVAREKYDKAIKLSVESANVRQKIVKNCELIRKLNKVKLAFEKAEE